MPLPAQSIVASGPVIIENDQVLLVKERKPDGSITPWLFPGGELENTDASLEATCVREVAEELGITITIVKPLKPFLITEKNRTIILIHWLAKRHGEIVPGATIAKWQWHNIHNLPDDCAPNIAPIINDLYISSAYDLRITRI